MASYYNFRAGKYEWHKDSDGLYFIDKDFVISLTDELGKTYQFLVKKGFRTDGGSIPKCFAWFAPSWKEDDEQYNACFVLHDGLYASELVNKDMADDMLRSSLRDVGMNRFHASTICFCVNHFAGKHYGKEHDKWNCSNYIVRRK